MEELTLQHLKPKAKTRLSAPTQHRLLWAVTVKCAISTSLSREEVQAHQQFTESMVRCYKDKQEDTVQESMLLPACLSPPLLHHLGKLCDAEGSSTVLEIYSKTLFCCE